MELLDSCQSPRLAPSRVALELRSLRSTIITRFLTTMDLSDSQLSPAPILADRRLPWLAPKHCAGSPVLTPLSFAHIPPPLPRSSRKMLATLSSLPGFGLRLAPTISTGTLGFSRLARRSIFIVVCTLADSLHTNLLHQRLQRPGHPVSLPRLLPAGT